MMGLTLCLMHLLEGFKGGCWVGWTMDRQISIWESFYFMMTEAETSLRRVYRLIFMIYFLSFSLSSNKRLAY